MISEHEVGREKENVTVWRKEPSSDLTDKADINKIVSKRFRAGTVSSTVVCALSSAVPEMLES